MILVEHMNIKSKIYATKAQSIYSRCNGVLKTHYLRPKV